MGLERKIAEITAMGTETRQLLEKEEESGALEEKDIKSAKETGEDRREKEKGIAKGKRGMGGNGKKEEGNAEGNEKQIGSVGKCGKFAGVAKGKGVGKSPGDETEEKNAGAV